jgi:hypothetical protein
MQDLTDSISVNGAERAIQELLNTQSEWFLAQDGASIVALQTSEFDFAVAHDRLIFSCWTAKGSRSWRVTSWSCAGDRLEMEATRRMGAERATLVLIPRASARALTAGVAAARQARCEKLAHLAVEILPGSSKVERAALSPGMRRDQPGRYARIVLRLPHERVAITANVGLNDPRNVDSLFSSALLWFSRVRERAHRPYVERLWLVVESEILSAARQRHVLLRNDLHKLIELFKIDQPWENLSPAKPLDRKELWKRRLSGFPLVTEPETSQSIAEIVAQAPEAIDFVRSRHGATLRYYGLPFARVRRLLESERVWFGLEGSPRLLLGERNHEDWRKLVRDLETHRSPTSGDQRHWLYRAAGEAWLESILRRDITRLDPGLIIAPLHAQFRTAHGGGLAARPIDLLALRHDGRPVVIELKVTEDREHVFQGVDYWRRVEAHRRRGHIATAKLFGDRHIADESPLVYLVAPMLRFHPSFATLAGTIAPEIEIYRLDINENWRLGVRVVRRTRANG